MPLHEATVVVREMNDFTSSGARCLSTSGARPVMNVVEALWAHSPSSLHRMPDSTQELIERSCQMCHWSKPTARNQTPRGLPGTVVSQHPFKALPSLKPSSEPIDSGRITCIGLLVQFGSPSAATTTTTNPTWTEL